jgi:hypothetical protein
VILWPPCGQEHSTPAIHRDTRTATTSRNVPQSYSTDVLTGFPKPRVAGSIPAGGTIKTAVQGLLGVRRGTIRSPVAPHWSAALPNAKVPKRLVASGSPRRTGRGGSPPPGRWSGSTRHKTPSSPRGPAGPPRLPRQPSSNPGLYRIKRKGLRIRFSQTGGDRATPG